VISLALSAIVTALVLSYVIFQFDIGDGNFSFSLSFCKKAGSSSEVNCSVLCTSFDSEEDVVAKYPEAVLILKKLSNFPNVEIQHTVDATKLLNYFPSSSFDEVIFNFPHLGFEDLILHRSLIAHLIQRLEYLNFCCILLILSFSANSVVNANGYFILSLAESQEIGWEM
jgi:hypothetical protein